jgi:hypothetical protein
MLSNPGLVHSVIQFIKDWTPLWLAIFAFLLNVYNQNLKTYREQRKEARIYFLKHRMLLKQLESLLNDYQAVITLNKRQFQDWVWLGIEEIKLDGFIDYNQERVIGYCVYSRIGDEQNLFRLYIDFIDKYNLLIRQAKEFESEIGLFFSKQRGDVEKLNQKFMAISQVSTQNAAIAGKISKLFQVELRDYYVDFMMPVVDFDLFKTKCVDRLQEIYQEYTKEHPKGTLKDADPLREKIDEIAHQLKTCIYNTEYWLLRFPVDDVLQTLKDLYYLMEQIDHIPFKGHRWYAWLDGK